MSRQIWQLLFVVAAIVAISCSAENLTPPIPQPIPAVCVGNPIVSPSSVTLHPGDTARITGRGISADACSAGPENIVWKVSDSGVASVVSQHDSVVIVLGKHSGVTTLTGSAAAESTVKGAALISVVP